MEFELVRRLLPSMMERGRTYSSTGKRKELPIQVASKESQDESGAEVTSVWTCPCRMVCGSNVGNDAPLSTERRRKLQRSRMNSLTYRLNVLSDKVSPFIPLRYTYIFLVSFLSKCDKN